MLEELASRDKVIGVKQSRRAIAEGKAAKAFFACDADPAVLEGLRLGCAEQGVPTEEDHSMSELGRACRISVGAAVAGPLK